ncbi:MAG: hypothetical protein CMH49_00815 [Myxococcales bacterium]|nr:hypothetical protein [Myxococcales bacterium]
MTKLEKLNHSRSIIEGVRSSYLSAFSRKILRYCILLTVIELCALFNGALSPLYSNTACAQRTPREAETTSNRLIQDARSYYNNLEMEPMDDALEQIISMADRFGNISPRFSDTLSQAFILKGLLAFVNSDNRSEAKRYFVKAIEAYANARLSDDLATPELRSIFEEAKRNARPSNSYNTYGQQQAPANSYGQPQPARPNPYGQQPQPARPNPYGQQPQPARPNPYGQQPQPARPNQYARQQANPYGQQQQPPSNPYGQQQPRSNPYGQAQQPSSNPYGQAQQPPSKTYGQQPTPSSPYGQQRPQANQYRQPQQARPNPYEQRQSSGPEVSHTPPAQLPGGRPFSVRVRISPYLRPQVYFVRLFYVSSGTMGKTQKLALRPSGDFDYEGAIRSEYIVGDRLQYFITLFDQSDSPIASYRNHKAPQVVRIVGGQYANLIGDGGFGSRQQVSNKILTTRLSSGFGSGTVQEGAEIQTEGSSKQAKPGFALSGLHLRIEADFWVMNSLSIGLNTRIQFDRDPPIAAFLAGGLIQWVFSEDQSNKWSLRLGGGYGEVAHLIPVAQNSDAPLVTGGDLPMNTGAAAMNEEAPGPTYTFLTKAGKVYYQLGFNYAFKISEGFAITFTTDFLHLIALQSPPDFPSKHFDFSLGFEFTL